MKKVDYKGLAPSTVKRVKAAYRLGLSNGKALQKLASAPYIFEVRKERDNALGKVSTYLTELGKKSERDATQWLPRCQTLLGGLGDGPGIGQCTLADKHLGDHDSRAPIVDLGNGELGRVVPGAEPACVVCDGKPSAENSPCVGCGAMVTAAGVNQYENDGTPPSVDNESGDCAP